MAATNCQALIEEEGWVTIRGGMLRQKVCHMPVMNVRWGAHRLRLTRLLQRDTHLAQLLTGRPACERPLSKLMLWRHLRQAINAGGGAPSAESAADDDDIGFEFDKTWLATVAHALHRLREQDHVRRAREDHVHRAQPTRPRATSQRRGGG